MEEEEEEEEEEEKEKKRILRSLRNRGNRIDDEAFVDVSGICIRRGSLDLTIDGEGAGKMARENQTIHVASISD